jgi:Phage integrase, N-terminal SAM-like domain
MSFNFNGARIRESAYTTSKTIAKQAEQHRRRELELGIIESRSLSEYPSSRSRRNDSSKISALAARKNTAELYRFALKPVIAEFGGRLLSDITPEDIAAYQAMRLREGMAARTINLEVGALRVTLKAYRLWGAMADGVEMRSIRT